MSGIIFTLIGQVQASLIGFLVGMYKPEWIAKKIVPLLTKYVGNNSQNKITNELAILMLEVSADLLTSIPDSKEVEKEALNIIGLKETIKEKLGK